MSNVLISGVGPRDGLQSAARTMPIAAKVAWIDALHAVGARTFDTSQGGLGGGLDAPGASGNVVTEDPVCVFDSIGVVTGIDIGKRIAARVRLQNGLPGEPIVGMTPGAGLPQGFVPASRAAHG